MQPAYFNTTNLNGDDLKKAIQSAGSLEEKVMAFFRNHHGNYTPWELQDLMDLNAFPITSLRRAITNLTTAGKLHKTGEKRPGRYGNANYAWELTRGKGF